VDSLQLVFLIQNVKSNYSHVGLKTQCTMQRDQFNLRHATGTDITFISRSPSWSHESNPVRLVRAMRRRSQPICQLCAVRRTSNVGEKSQRFSMHQTVVTCLIPGHLTVISSVALGVQWQVRRMTTRTCKNDTINKIHVFCSNTESIQCQFSTSDMISKIFRH